MLRTTLCAAALLHVGCGGGSSSEVPLGEADALARHACSRVDAAGASITASPVRDDLAGALLGSSMEPYTVTLPEGGTGWVGLDVPEPHYDWVLFVREAGRTHDVHDASDALVTARRNGACPESILEDYRIHYHVAGRYPVELRGSGALWMLFLQGGSDHAPDGGHEHDGGGHGHDGGDEHDGGGHDGGGDEHDGGGHDGGGHGHDAG